MQYQLYCSFISREDLGNLPYLTRCIKESMRLHSPVPNVAREVDTEFDIEGVTLPVGSRLCVNIVGLHHNKTVWGEDTEVITVVIILYCSHILYIICSVK